MKKKTAKKAFLEEHRVGFEVDELHRKIDVVVEHVTGLTTKVDGIEKDVRVIRNKVEIIEVKLVGKANQRDLDHVERRVTRLEQAAA